MTTRSVLVRGVDADTLAEIDAAARRAGKSRQAYLREALQGMAHASAIPPLTHICNGIVGWDRLCGTGDCRALAVGIVLDVSGNPPAYQFRYFCAQHKPPARLRAYC